MSTEGGAASAHGNTSEVNEDAYLVQDGMGLYVVADGASNRAAGETAARIAVSTLEEVIGARRGKGLGAILSTFPSRRSVRRAMREVMSRIIEASVSDEALGGMTAAVTMLLADGEKAFVSHFGDSRLYLARDGSLHQLTSDHEMALGPEGTSAEVYRDVPVEVFSIDLLETDVFFLCTDGAEEAVANPSLLARLGDLPPRAIAAEVIAQARKLDASRDATVVVVRVLEEEDSGRMEASEPLSPWAYGYALEYIEIG